LGAVWGHDVDAYLNEDGTVKSIEEIQKELWDEWTSKKATELPSIAVLVGVLLYPS